MGPTHYVTPCGSETETPVDRREGIFKAQQDCDIAFGKKLVVLALHQIVCTMHVARAVSEGDRSGVHTPFTSGSAGSGERPFRRYLLGKITYCCSVWYSPSKKEGRKTNIVKTLDSIQVRAARTITGAFKATSTAALNIEAYLPPIGHVIARSLFETILRMATTPSYAEITAPRARLGEKKRKSKCRARSPLEQPTDRFVKQLGLLDNIEEIHPYIVPTDWKPPLTYFGGREDAVKRLADANSRGLHTYSTDGSGINGKIRAAMVSKELFGVARVYLGTKEAFTVYSAELYGTLLALHDARNHHSRHRQIYIFVDNQAAIRTISQPGLSSVKFISD